MTSKERFRAVCEFRLPDRFPMDYLATPATDARLCEYYDVATQDDLLDVLGIDFYYLSFRDISQNESSLPFYHGPELEMNDQENGAVRLHFSDGANKAGAWTSDPGLLKEGQLHHITTIVGGGPNIITFVVDGKLCDGGKSRQYGWDRFDPKIGDVNGSDKLRLSPSFTGEILSLRVYDRTLRTSEAVANYLAEKGKFE